RSRSRCKRGAPPGAASRAQTCAIVRLRSTMALRPRRDRIGGNKIDAARIVPAIQTAQEQVKYAPQPYRPPLRAALQPTRQRLPIEIDLQIIARLLHPRF